MRFPAVILAATLLAVPALAALKPGDAAPDFTAPASLGGKQFSFSLSDALKKGPVVLYFYPAAFTPGCTLEAHEFAEAIDKYAALGATVIGVSADDIDTLDRFSVSECRSNSRWRPTPTARSCRRTMRCSRANRNTPTARHM